MDSSHIPPGESWEGHSSRVREIDHLRALTAQVRAANPGVDRWRAIAKSVLAQMKFNHVNVAAGAFAYRWFLAIFPIIIALLGIAALVAVPRHVVLSLLSGATKALPAGASTVFTDAIKNATQHAHASLWTVIIASVVALWSSTSGMVVVELGLDMAYGLPRDRSFVQKRLLAIPLLLAATILGSAASTLVIFGPQLGTELRHAVPFVGDSFSLLWTIVRWVVAIGLMNLLISFFYYVAPNRPLPRWRWTSIGSLFATIVWAIVSLGFSLYTTSFGSYGRTYGAFAGVAILIFWLYLTGLAILVGAEIDATIHRDDVTNPELSDDVMVEAEIVARRFAARLHARTRRAN